jgi:hypothetical protein
MRLGGEVSQLREEVDPLAPYVPLKVIDGTSAKHAVAAGKVPTPCPPSPCLGANLELGLCGKYVGTRWPQSWMLAGSRGGLPSSMINRFP